MLVEDINSDIHSRGGVFQRVQDLLQNEEYVNRYKEKHPEITTNSELIKALLKEPNKVASYIIHKHEGITLDLINKYIDWNKYFPKDLSEYENYKIVKRIDTKEVHDCNLVELTPELHKKAYRGHRGDRSTYSHLINREDFVGEDGKQLENKTSTLSVVASIEPIRNYYGDPEGEPVIQIITAYWGDGSAEDEIRWFFDFDESKERTGEEYQEYLYQKECLEYRMNHALIVEEDEDIRRDYPGNIDYYTNKIKNKKLKEIKSYIDNANILLEFKQFCLQYMEDENNSFNAMYYGCGKNFDEYEYFNDNDKEKILEYLKNVRQTSKGDISSFFRFLKIKKYEALKYEEKVKENKAWDIYDDRLLIKEKMEISDTISNAMDEFPIKNIEVDEYGGRLIELILGNKKYKIFEPNLENYTDGECGNDGCIEFEGGNIDERKNEKLKNYIKYIGEKKGVHIPKQEELEEFFGMLGKELNYKRIGDKEVFFSFMYLAGIYGEYLLTHGYLRLVDYIKEPGFYGCGRKFGKILMFSCEEIPGSDKMSTYTKTRRIRRISR